VPLPPQPIEPPAREEWPAEPGFTALALDERPAEEPGLWTAAADPIDVTDATIDMPALAPVSRRRAARAGRAALTAALVLGCAGAAVAASGVLKTKRETTAPPTVSGSSVVAASRTQHAEPAHRRRAVHHRAHRHKPSHVARHHVAAAPAQPVAAAPVSSAPAPARTPSAPVRRVVSRPAPSPAPKPAPKPVATAPAPSPQPAASAPSGEPGRQPPPSP
jgi:hypothetical protein